jgi:hypothetical protein
VKLAAREVVAVGLVAVALAVVMHAPLIPRITDSVPGRVSVDPLLQAWEVAWGGHVLLHQPTNYFDANAFWPLRDSLAFSDALVGYAPAGLVGSGIYSPMHSLSSERICWRESSVPVASAPP